MGYYMRYLITDNRDVTLPTLDDALRRIDPDYIITGPSGSRESGDLLFRGSPYGQLEFNRPGDGLFDEEVEELTGEVRESGGRGKRAVMKALRETKVLLAVQVLFQDRTQEQTLERIEPLWAWLFENRPGLLQADGEGYYDKAGLILQVE